MIARDAYERIQQYDESRSQMESVMMELLELYILDCMSKNALDYTEAGFLNRRSAKILKDRHATL